jgi:hypothetical protein
MNVVVVVVVRAIFAYAPAMRIGDLIGATGCIVPIYG